MEKEAESSIELSHDLNSFGYSEKQLDLDVELRTGALQQLRRRKTYTKKGVVNKKSTTASTVYTTKTKKIFGK